MRYTLPNGRTGIVESATVETLTAAIREHTPECSSLKIVAAGRIVSCDEDLMMAEDVSVFYELDGGARGKRKKKQYTTPKHQAHKRKKVKLAVLKYYSIDGDTIKNLRTNCAGSCPDGVKMAHHENRSHCGRCGTTLFRKE